jgi:hypothetical protein
LLFALAGGVGRRGFEPLKSKDSGFTVRPIWPLWNLPFFGIAKIELSHIQKADLKFYFQTFPEPKTGVEPATY